MNSPIDSQKQRLRDQIRSARVSLAGRRERSRHILDRVTATTQYQTCKMLLAYVGHRSEVETFPLIEQRLLESKPTCVPWCEAGELQLFRLKSLDDLEPGSYGIKEPRRDLRTDASRIVDLSEIDLILVPGIAFDRSGGRLGQGRGYYDKLLHKIHSGTISVGLAFDCQLVESVPRESHDVLMDVIVTESNTFVR